MCPRLRSLASVAGWQPADNRGHRGALGTFATVTHALRAPPGHEKCETAAYARTQAAECLKGGSVWCCEPAQQFAPGCPEASRSVAPIWEARRADALRAGHPLDRSTRRAC